MTDNKLNPDTFARAYAGVNLTEPKILLTHYPEHVDSGLITEENADIVLSGGTHGGQVGLKFIRDFLAPSEKLEYVAGKYIVQGVTLYVNRGIGSVGDMQADTIRLFCRPEITEVAFSNK
jgi:predicted MPP superfamily phosphohydrolase